MSGAVFCFSLYHVCPAHSRKSVGSAGFHFGALSEEYPGWNDFLTFSTGFSTDFVKKKWGFPQCFPLFPPSFPPFWKRSVIPVVFFQADAGNFWGEIEGFFLFSKRKSRAKIYFSRLSAPGCFQPLQSGIFEAAVFHMEEKQKRPVEKRGKTPVLPKKEASMKPTEASF